VANGTVYAEGGYGEDHHLYALDAETGREEWRFDGDDGIGFPAVADGTVYIGTYDTYLYALDAETGQEQWRFEVDSSTVHQPPVVADGTIYIRTRHDNSTHHVHALGSGSGIEDKDQLIARVPFDEAPSSVKEKARTFFQNSGPSVCSEASSPTSVYRVESGDGIRPIYFTWTVGCPNTRGRGSMGIFDGRSGNRIGNFFGYYITGPADNVEVKPKNSSTYPGLVIRREGSKNVRLGFDESSGEYEDNTNW
jgi:hypothetical protein